MYQGAETKEMRDARLEKAALERDRAVELLRRWASPVEPSRVVFADTVKFLESLT